MVCCIAWRLGAGGQRRVLPTPTPCAKNPRSNLMSLYLTPERKAAGKANFETAVGAHGAGPNRREFMKGLIAAATALPVSAAAYFGYQKLHGNPVKVGLIGAGDEGGVLVGEHNPEYLEFVAVADLRPSNKKRI